MFLDSSVTGLSFWRFDVISTRRCICCDSTEERFVFKASLNTVQLSRRFYRAMENVLFIDNILMPYLQFIKVFFVSK